MLIHKIWHCQTLGPFLDRRLKFHTGADDTSIECFCSGVIFTDYKSALDLFISKKTYTSLLIAPMESRSRSDLQKHEHPLLSLNIYLTFSLESSDK